MAKGIDYAFAPHPGIIAMRNAGVKFVGRYVSPQAINDTNGKNLLEGECRSLLGAGIAIILYAEQYAGRMTEGHPAGVADAKHFDAVTESLKLGGIVMYCAADFDATPAQQASINAYLDGAASVIGRQRTGIYGGYYPVHRALNAGKALYAVQTVAWSGGRWDPRVNVRQKLTVRIGGASCDVLTSLTADYGQYPRPGKPAGPLTVDTRFTADGHTSLRELAHAHGTAPAHALWVTAQHQPNGFGGRQTPYVNGEDWDAPMPKGMTIWLGPS